MTTRHDVARMIDHTLLKPESTPEQVAALVADAKRPSDPTLKKLLLRSMMGE